MSTRILSHIRRKLSLFSPSTPGSKHSAFMYDDLNWHRSRHRRHKPHNHLHNHPKLSVPQQVQPSTQFSPTATHAESHDFDIVSFNLLAPVYKRLTTKNFAGRRDREASKNDLWQDRLAQTIDFFKQEIYKDTAIIALQEYWLDDRYRELFETEFRKHGYEYRIMQRAGTKVDAVALVIKTEVFDILGVENVDLCAMGDRVALLVWLRHKQSGLDVLVANTHLSFPHNVFDRLNQVAQMKHLTSVIDWFSRTHGVTSAPVLIMGDFNVEGHSPVCDHLRSAGYYSCFEVCPPANSTVSPYPPRSLEDVVLSVEHEASTAEVFHGPEVGSKVLEYLPTTADIHTRSAIGSSAGGDVCDSRVQGGAKECDDVGDDCVPVDDCADGDGNSTDCIDAHTSTTTNKTTTTTNTTTTTTDTTSTTTSTTDSGTITSSSTHHTQAIFPTSQRRVSYVSHFNHRSEQVGVDHFFLKPNLSVLHEELKGDLAQEKWDKLPKRPCGVTTQEAVPAYLSMNSSGVNSANSNVNNVNSVSDDNSNTTNTYSTSDTVVGSVLTEDSNTNNANTTTSRVYVAECQVLPTALHCTSWSEEFLISDHRPVRTKIVFTK